MTDEAIGTIGFPDMPGKMNVDFVGFDKYKGAQRAIVALLYANDTFGADPSVRWFVHGDDDTLFRLDLVQNYFADIGSNSDLPLFLAPKGASSRARRAPHSIRSAR